MKKTDICTMGAGDVEMIEDYMSTFGFQPTLNKDQAEAELAKTQRAHKDELAEIKRVHDDKVSGIQESFQTILSTLSEGDEEGRKSAEKRRDDDLASENGFYEQRVQDKVQELNERNDAASENYHRWCEQNSVEPEALSIDFEEGALYSKDGKHQRPVPPMPI